MCLLVGEHQRETTRYQDAGVSSELAKSWSIKRERPPPPKKETKQKQTNPILPQNKQQHPKTKQQKKTQKTKRKTKEKYILETKQKQTPKCFVSR